MKMIKQPTIPPMPKQPTFDARDTQYNLPIGTDCISRQKAINALYEWEFDNKDGRDAIDVINGLPTILPERKECEEREQGKCPWYAG